MIHCDQLGLRLGQQARLQDINLHIDAAGISVVLGANGAGKTLLLKLVAGLLAPTTGHLRITHPHIHSPIVTWVPQTPVLLDRSVRDNIALPLYTQDKATVAQRVSQALAWANIDDLAHLPALTLSTGQQQLVALARAWAIEPQLLLLDEPCANLDPNRQQHVEALIQQLSAEGCKVLMSSHHLSQVKRLASDIVFLDQGSVHQASVATHMSVEDFFNHMLGDHDTNRTETIDQGTAEAIRAFIQYA